MIIDRDKHNKYVVGWKPNYTVPTNQGSSSGTNVTIVYGGGGSGSSTPVSSEAFSYYKVSDGENAITQEAKVLKDIANLSIIGDEGIKVELITDPTIFEASFTSTGTNTGVYKISYGKVTTVVEKPETLAEEPTEPEVVITFPMTITYVSGEKIKAELFDTLRLLKDIEEVATYPSSGLTIEGDADGILSISLEVYKEVLSVDEEGKPVLDAEGNPVMEKQGLYFNRILLTTLLEDQPSTQAEGDSTEEEPQQPTYESLLSFDVVVNIDTVIKLSVTAVSGLWKLDDNGNIYTEYNAYSLKELSAYGLDEGEAGEGAGFLHELGDVSIPDPNAIPDNAILQYNIETGKWEAVELELPEDSATREWVELKFKDLINGAPADLDTLGEIAIAIQELQQLLDWFSFVDGRIRANYNFWGVGEVSAYGPASGSDPGTGGGAGYLHELGDVTINNDTLANGLIIVWDEDSLMWVNVDFPGLDEDALALYLTQNKYATLEWVNGLLDPINNKLEEFQTTIDMINDMFEWDNGKIKAKATLYSVGEISAYGAGEGSSGTGGYLHELDDVLLTSLLDDLLLMYDATTEKWVNVDKDEVGLNETQLALYLTEHNYAIMSNVVPITRRIIAGDGLQGGGPLSSDVTLSMAPLTASDIPGLDWSKIISGKPTTLAGYGITDGVNAVSVTGTGNAVTTASISGHTLTLTKALSFALITGTNATGTWPISITGNAATANKWTTARTITLAGAVIGSTSIDGSGNVTITTTYTTDNISALDGRYVNVTGDTMTGNLTLPTLQANTSIILGSVKLEYDSANNALKISNVNTQLVINLYATGEISAYGYNAGSAGGGVSALDDLDDVTLSNLLNGQALVYNSSTGQWVNTTILAGGIDETALAQYLTNNQYVTMPTGDGRYALKDGSNATGTWPISITGNAATATKLALQDTRSVNTAPFAHGEGLVYHFKNNTADGLNDGGTYHSVLQFNQWGESSGGLCKQLALTDSGNMWFRNASSATAWGAWKKLLDSSNYSSIIGNSFVKKTGDTMTGTLITHTRGTGAYNQGIRINRTALDQWATLTIGYVGAGSSGTSANTWLIGTPSSSNSLIFNLNNADATKGLCLKGHGTNDIVWNNQAILHAANYNNYAPTKTGGGASGTWGINVSGSAAVAGRLSSTYTENGGNQPPSYFNGMGLKVNMMAIPVQYSDVVVVNGYRGGGFDVPYINAIAFQKTSGTHGEVYHASGNYGASSWKTWYRFLDEYNYSSILDGRYVNVSGDTMTGNLIVKAAPSTNGIVTFNNPNNAEAYIYVQAAGVNKGAFTTNNSTYGTCIFDATSNRYLGIKTDGTPHFQGYTLWHAGNDGSGSGLDADLLDGLHSTSLMRYSYNLVREVTSGGTIADLMKTYDGYARLMSVNGWGWASSKTIVLNSSYSIDIQRYSLLDFRHGNLNGSWQQKAVLCLPTYLDSKMIYIAQMYTGGTAGSVLTNVLRYADYDTILASNVYSATQLQTARTIWGQSFNGTANVSGNMTGVGSISASGNITAPSFYASNWFRSTGQTGWYSETYGGGWYMTDTTWLRAYNGKGILTTSSIQGANLYATSRFYVSAYGTNYLGAGNGDNATTSTYNVKLHLHWGMAVTDNGDKVTMLFNGRSGTIFTTGGLYSNGYVSALGQNSSDARLKTNIQDFKATTLIKQLHPKSFKWNDLAKSKFEVFRNTGTQYGLIAQDVKEVMPEWVDDNLIGSGYMGIRYDKLIPVLLQGEIETIGRVETLEDKVKRLETENSKLKAKLSKLERRIR